MPLKYELRSRVNTSERQNNLKIESGELKHVGDIVLSYKKVSNKPDYNTGKCI